jgi:hypothetical protein
MAVFRPDLPTIGDYGVFTWVGTATTRATNQPFTITITVERQPSG